ncbi:AAA family ATPase [Cytobacillus gottheilii]|uniref:AAA family ATPase n=1 Tax=Cytobacillus gottheilii TaxID=859144 RepID=UPI0024955F69|nr:AAA family ATPase [Cytobacillus gottheilii]
MAMFIMLVGLPASGKSTLAETLSIKYAAEVLSSDRLRKEIHGDENIQADHKKLFLKN